MDRPGPVKPKMVPVEGVRGGMYVGIFMDLLRRNGTRGGQARLVFNRFAKKFFVPEGVATLYIGRPDPRKNIREKVNKVWGPKWNVPFPMIPEFEIVKDTRDPETELAKHGWRFLLTQCVVNGFVRPTEEVKKWLGPREFLYAKSAYNRKFR